METFEVGNKEGEKGGEGMGRRGRAVIYPRGHAATRPRSLTHLLIPPLTHPPRVLAR